MMKKPIDEFTDPAALRRIMANAKRLNNDDVWGQAFRRLCSLEGMKQTIPLHRDFYATLAAYEQLLIEKNGRTTVASRTRQKLANKGIVKCLEDWALNSTPTEGFRLLTEKGLVALTGEYLVTRYPENFTVTAVQAARTRLSHLLPPSG